MREIKFRAWIIPKPDEDLPIDPTPYMAIQGEPDLETLFSFMFYYGDKEHLMQFTGLKDKNGTDIYEGDVVDEVTIGYDLAKPDGEDEIEIRRRSVIIYDNHGFWVKDEGFGWEGEGLWNWDKLEVIGNIYQNPELLK